MIENKETILKNLGFQIKRKLKYFYGGPYIGITVAISGAGNFEHKFVMKVLV